MIKDDLVQLYMREYERANRKYRGGSGKAKGATEKTASLARALKRTKDGQVTRNALEN